MAVFKAGGGGAKGEPRMVSIGSLSSRDFVILEAD